MWGPMCFIKPLNQRHGVGVLLCLTPEAEAGNKARIKAKVKIKEWHALWQVALKVQEREKPWEGMELRHEKRPRYSSRNAFS